MVLYPNKLPESERVCSGICTGKCFFVYGFETGAVSEKFINGEISNPVISQVCSPDTGDMFYMLHQKGDGGAPTLATL